MWLVINKCSNNGNVPLLHYVGEAVIPVYNELLCSRKSAYLQAASSEQISCAGISLFKEVKNCHPMKYDIFI